MWKLLVALACIWLAFWFWGPRKEYDTTTNGRDWWKQYTRNDNAEETENHKRREIIVKDGPVIGIDLGTTYSCVGIFKNGQVDIIANDQGNRITPSYVAFSEESGERLIGDAAKSQLTINPKNTVFNVKRLIGREFTDSTLKDEIKLWPFKVIDKSNQPYVQVKVGGYDKIFAPEEVSAMVLGKMKEIAEVYLGEPAINAVVTVPAYFNDAQRQATMDAGKIAGLNVVRLINEATAAAIAYGLHKNNEQNILVFDLGGGTIDVSMLFIKNGYFEVLATSGVRLGGEDFDRRVLEYFIKRYKRKTGIDISTDNRAVQKLRREVERAKRALSAHESVSVDVESLTKDEDFSETLTRAKFEELNMDLFQSTMKHVRKVLEDSDLEKDDVHEIILVGGSTRIPKVQQLIKEFFSGKELSRGIDPDEAVAFGAAVLAGIISKEEDTSDLVLIDVIPMTLSIEVDGSVMTTFIKRNTAIPIKRSQVFSTTADSQDTVTISVYEGERLMNKYNNMLGKFNLTGISPAPRGVPQIMVTFEIDIYGILHITAEDKISGNKNKLTIAYDQNHLSPENMERMINIGVKFVDEDKKKKNEVEARDALESYAYSLKKLSDKLSEDEKKMIEVAVDEAISWIEGNKYASVDDLQQHKKDLEAVIQPIVSKLYEGAGGTSPPTGDEEHGGEDKKEL